MSPSEFLERLGKFEKAHRDTTADFLYAQLEQKRKTVEDLTDHDAIMKMFGEINQLKSLIRIYEQLRKGI